MKAIFCLLLIFASFYSYAQKADSLNRKIRHEAYKNVLRFYYEPVLTKTNFRLEESISSDFFLDYMLKYNPASRPLSRSTYGVEYIRILGKFKEWGCWIRLLERGQQSPSMYNYNNPLDPSYYTSTYGATSYLVRYKSTELGTFFNKQIYYYKDFSIYYKLGLSMDVYNTMLFNDLVLNKDIFIKDYGTEERTYGGAAGSYFKRFYSNLFSGYIRLGFSASFDFRYNLNERFYMTLAPELEFFSNILSNDAFIRSGSILRGTAFLGGVQCGISYKF